MKPLSKARREENAKDAEMFAEFYSEPEPNKQKETMTMTRQFENEHETRLAKKIDERFLEILVEAAKCQTGGDAIETHNFVEYCFDLIGKRAPRYERHENSTKDDDAGR